MATSSTMPFADKVKLLRSLDPQGTAGLSDAAVVRHWTSRIDASGAPDDQKREDRAFLQSRDPSDPQISPGKVFLKGFANSAAFGIPSLAIKDYYTDEELQQRSGSKDLGEFAGMFVPGGLAKLGVRGLLKAAKVGTTSLPRAIEGLKTIKESGGKLSALRNALLKGNTYTQALGGVFPAGMAAAQPSTAFSMEKTRQREQDAALDPAYGPREGGDRALAPWLSAAGGAAYALPGGLLGKVGAVAAPLAGAALSSTAQARADNEDPYDKFSEHWIQNILMPLGFGAMNLKAAKAAGMGAFGKKKALEDALDPAFKQEVEAAQAAKAAGSTAQTTTTSAQTATPALAPATQAPAASTRPAAQAAGTPAAAAAAAPTTAAPAASRGTTIDERTYLFSQGLVGKRLKAVIDREYQARQTRKSMNSPSFSPPKMPWVFIPEGDTHQLSILDLHGNTAKVVTKPGKTFKTTEWTSVPLNERDVISFADPFATTTSGSAKAGLPVTGETLMSLGDIRWSNEGPLQVGNDMVIWGGRGADEVFGVTRQNRTPRWMKLDGPEIPAQSDANRLVRGHLESIADRDTKQSPLHPTRSFAELMARAKSGAQSMEEKIRDYSAIMADMQQQHGDSGLIAFKHFLSVFEGKREAALIMRQLAPSAAAPAAATTGTAAAARAPRRRVNGPSAGAPTAPWPEGVTPQGKAAASTQTTAAAATPDSKAGLPTKPRPERPPRPPDSKDAFIRGELVQIGDMAHTAIDDTFYYDAIAKKVVPIPGRQVPPAVLETAERMLPRMLEKKQLIPRSFKIKASQTTVTPVTPATPSPAATEPIVIAEGITIEPNPKGGWTLTWRRGDGAKYKNYATEEEARAAAAKAAAAPPPTPPKEPTITGTATNQEGGLPPLIDPSATVTPELTEAGARWVKATRLTRRKNEEVPAFAARIYEKLASQASKLPKGQKEQINQALQSYLNSLLQQG